MDIQPPRQREEFKIGIICALPLEYDAASLAFDEFYDENEMHYGKLFGDHNVYTTGRIGNHNVVLFLLSRMGKVSATSAATTMRLSYSGLS
jgi:nucleoside phosphorylase